MGRGHNWFQEYRYDWIVEAVRVYGFINRYHVVRKFGVSTPQASMDIQEVLKRYPELLEFNSNTKCYQLLNLKGANREWYKGNTYTDMDAEVEEGQEGIPDPHQRPD